MLLFVSVVFTIITVGTSEVADIIDETHFTEAIVKSDRVQIVYFARDVPACKIFASTWEEVSKSSKRLNFAIVQMDKTSDAWALGVQFNMHKQKLPYVMAVVNTGS